LTIQPGVAEKLTVRVGMPDDVHRMMDIALLATSENGFAVPNKIKLLQEIWAALNLRQGIIGIIGNPGEMIEGAALLRIGQTWYSDEPILEEKAIFIHPDYRSAKGGRAARLCEFSKKASDELGIPLTIGVLSNARTAAKVRMYTRIMGPPSGAYWLYNTTTGGHDGAASVANRE
jgi:hypothetical protein